MNNKIIISAVVILLIAGGVFLSKKDKNQKGNNQSAQKIVERTEKAIGNTTGSIVVPENIKKVTDELRQKYQKQICEKEPVVYCEYYTEVYKKTGKKRISNLQWSSLCALAKALGRRNSDLYEYETIGYEEGPCYQGMYKTK